MTEPCGQCGHPIADEETVTVNQPSGGPSYRIHRRCAALLPVAEAPPQDALEIAAIRAFWTKPVALPKCQRCGHEQAWPAQTIPSTFPHGHVCGKCGGEWWILTTTTEFRDARQDIPALIAEIERLRAASCAPRTPAEPEGWQPIETAPKNGLPIVLGFWDKPSKLGFWSQLKMEWLRLGAPSPTTLEPTHWMPLPASPTEKAPTR